MPNSRARSSRELWRGEGGGGGVCKTARSRRKLSWTGKGREARMRVRLQPNYQLAVVVEMEVKGGQ